MKTIVGILAGALLASGACRKSENAERDDRFPKPIERVDPVPAPAMPGSPETPAHTGDEMGGDEKAFEDDRKTYADRARERLDRIEARVAELEARGDETARASAARLRARQDDLRLRVESIKSRARSGWNEFKADFARVFDDLEREAEEAFQPDDPDNP